MSITEQRLRSESTREADAAGQAGELGELGPIIRGREVRTGNTYAVRVTAYTVRGAVTFLRFERKSDGSVVSTIRNFGFTELGAPIERSVVEKPIAGAQFTRLLDEIQRQNFFTMASAGTVATVDAPVCLIEVFDGRAFHSAFRAQCPRNTPFGTVAMRATEIAGVESFVN